jgi:hypothetical protein
VTMYVTSSTTTSNAWRSLPIEDVLDTRFMFVAPMSTVDCGVRVEDMVPTRTCAVYYFAFGAWRARRSEGTLRFLCVDKLSRRDVMLKQTNFLAHIQTST